MKKALLLIKNLLNKIGLVLLVLIVITVFIQVFSRYVLQMPLTLSEEFAKLCFVWMIFLGLGLVSDENGHIQVEFFVELFSSKVQLIIKKLMDLVLIAFLVTIFFQGLDFVKAQHGMRSIALNVPITVFSWAIPVGMFFEVIFNLYKLFTQWELDKPGVIENVIE